MYRIDLHTHSIISYDGGISMEQYRQFLADRKNILAVTDHNQIDFARKLNQDFPDQVIVGEEILTTEGEVIGLYIDQLIAANLTVEETIRQIRQQNGLVYIPHPLEHTRKGLPLPELEKIVNQIDIIEIYNARSKEPWLTKKVEEFAKKNNLVGTASSDAHSFGGLGSTFAAISKPAAKDELIELLKSATLEKRRATFASMLAPLRNKIKKKLGL